MDSKDLLFLESVALQSGLLLLKRQVNVRRAEESHRAFSTEADFESDALIRRELSGRFPDAAFLTEEGGGERVTIGKLFIVDALDGTINYAYRDELWGVSIALLVDDAPELGVLYLPQRGMLYSASRHNGGQAIHVFTGRVVQMRASSRQRLKDCHIWTSWQKGPAEPILSILKKLFEHTFLPNIRCCAIEYLVRVAEGRTDGCVLYGSQPEDIAAAALIAEETGVRVTEIDGSPWSPYSQTIVASNGHIHQELLDLLNS